MHPSLPFSPSFYIALFSLSETDAQKFQLLIENDVHYDEMIQDCTVMWREELRPHFPNPVLCRQMFLARSVFIAVRHAVMKECARPVAAAFALYICDRVELMVLELDSKEATR